MLYCVCTRVMSYTSIITLPSPLPPQLMRINSEWDKEYREQEEAFRRYQFDAQQAQSENHTIIARLKEKIASLEEERDRIQDELLKYQRELHTLRERLAVSESMKVTTGGMPMEEELSLLRQQVILRLGESTAPPPHGPYPSQSSIFPTHLTEIFMVDIHMIHTTVELGEFSGGEMHVHLP